MNDIILISIKKEELKGLLREVAQELLSSHKTVKEDTANCLIGAAEVKQLLGLRSDSHFWKLRRETNFPSPIDSITKRNLKWRKQDVLDWINKR